MTNFEAVAILSILRNALEEESEANKTVREAMSMAIDLLARQSLKEIIDIVSPGGKG